MCVLSLVISFFYTNVSSVVNANIIEGIQKNDLLKTDHTPSKHELKTYEQRLANLFKLLKKHTRNPDETPIHIYIHIFQNM